MRNGKKGRGEQEEKMYCGCKTPPWNCWKIINTRKKEKIKKHRKDPEEKTEEKTEKVGENIVTRQIEMWEYDLFFFFFSSIKPYLTVNVNSKSRQERGYRLDRDPFFFSE